MKERITVNRTNTVNVVATILLVKYFLSIMEKILLKEKVYHIYSVMWSLHHLDIIIEKNILTLGKQVNLL